MSIPDEQRITDEVRKRPVQMTAREQSILASLCEVLAGFARDIESEIDPNADKVVDRLLGVVDGLGARSVEFGKLYDKLHRTGANA